MNLAYYRTTNQKIETVLSSLRQKAKQKSFDILGETSLPNNTGVIVHLCNRNWISNLIASDKNLIGLLPCSIVVLSKNEQVVVGVGSATVLGSVSQNPQVVAIAGEADNALKTLIHESAGIGPLTVSAVKLYATTTCPYCKMEASWLEEKKVKFDEVLVDQNQKEAQDMVQKTGQMGVPVTGITYDNGEEEYIVGFDRGRLATILGIGA